MKTHTKKPLLLGMLAAFTVTGCATATPKCATSPDTINQVFVDASMAIASSPNLRVSGVTAGPACTHKITIANTSTGKTSTMHLLADRETIIFGDAYNLKNSESTAKPAPTPQPAPAQNVTDSSANTASQATSVENFYASARNMPGVTINPNGGVEMIIFFDPFCRHCHNLYLTLQATNHFKQRWIPISIGVSENSLKLAAKILHDAETMPDAGLAAMKAAMSNPSQVKLEYSATAFKAAASNTQTIVPILMQAKRGTPLIMIKTRGQGIVLHPGDADLLQLEKWAS